MEMTGVKIGDIVTFYDSYARPHPALVTNVFGGQEGKYEPSVNVVVISEDSTKTDTYGRQVERQTSVPHASYQQSPGYKWEARQA